ncbi:hypothetical protein H6G64_31285 [Calothrix sp. FACHB-156]|nr:hypothetical protein [Calothrix sp. FACHB-156]
MEPITTGTIVFITWLLGKIIDWSTDKTFDIASEHLMQLLKQKFPDTAETLTAAAERATLSLNEREDIGEAVLVEEVKKAAANDPEIKAAVEALGNDVNQVINENPELEKRFTTVIENWQGINIKGGKPKISNNTFKFGGK